MKNAPDLTEEQKDAAALWHARRAGGSLSAREEEAFEAWLNADIGNRLAYDQIRVLWGQLEAPARRVAGNAAPGLLRGWRRKAAAGLASVAVAAMLALSILDPALMASFIPDWRADIVSGDSPVTRASLPDGSTVHLGPGTALAMDFSDGQRAVTLLQGQAYFEVKHREGDPFTVAAGDATVQVVGTHFDVDLLPARTQVTVSEGAVRVHSPEGGAGILLRDGQQVQVREGRVGSAAAVDTKLALSWMQGRISVEDARLADLAAMLGRYADGRVMVLGDARERRLSGTFPVSDIGASLETVAQATGVRLLTAGPWLTLLY